MLILCRQWQVGSGSSAAAPVVCWSFAVHEALTSRMVAAVSAEGPGVSPSGAAAGADLGGSSKYSSEDLED